MKPNVVVSMIVKNESKIIERCLDSIKKAVTGVNLILNISDTGSTDGTYDIIKKWGKDNNVSTFIHKWTMFLGGHVHHMSEESIKLRYNINIEQSNFVDVHWYMGVHEDERLSLDKYNDHHLEKDLFPHLVTPVYLVTHDDKKYHMNVTEFVNFLNRIPIDGEFIESEHFVNFGFNRNKNLNRAEEITELMRLDPERTFILLCDADMNLMTKSFNFTELDNSVAWKIIQHNAGLKYYNVRLLRANHQGKYSFKTHEYYETPGKIGTLDGSKIWYEDRSDGGSKQAKYERDEEMLSTELDGQRKFYYLGSSQLSISERCMSNSRLALLKTTQEHLVKLSNLYKHKAYDSFTKASSYTTYLDETMWSLLKLCKIRLNDGPVDDAEIGRQIVLHTKASYYRPDRAEPYYYLAKYLRELDSKLTKGVMTVAYESCMKALQIVKNIPQYGLFVDSNCNLHNIHFELSIISFYANDFVQGLRSCDYLLSSEHSRAKAYDDSKYYTTKLGTIKKTSIHKSSDVPKISHYTPILTKYGVTLCRHQDNYYRLFSTDHSSLIFKLDDIENLKLVRTSRTSVNIFTNSISGSIDLVV